MTVVDRAVSDTDNGMAEFYLLNCGLSSRNSLTIGRPDLPFLESEQKTSVGVPTLKLITFCEGSGLLPNVIKIDVEGAEGALVLQGGASRILKEFQPVVIVSIHPFWLPPSDSVSGILDWMDRCGYRVKDSRVTRYESQEIVDYLFSR